MTDRHAKLNKLEAEYAKNAAKLSALQARQRELDRQRTELKNNEILGLVREHHLDYAALSALIQKLNTSRPAAMDEEMEEQNED